MKLEDISTHTKTSDQPTAAYGPGLPPAGGWKRYMTEDPTEYSPEFQDEYRRLWHEAAAERDALREAFKIVEQARQHGNVLYWTPKEKDALRLLRGESDG